MPLDRIIDPFHRQLAQQINDDIGTLTEGLIGNAASDYIDYRVRVATITTLRSVLDICHEIEVRMQGGGQREEGEE